MKKGFAFICYFLVVLTGFAQQDKKAISGIVIGNIIDSATGAGIAGATMQLISIDNSANNISYLAGKNGSFEISGIPFGFYRLIFSSSGMATFTLDSIHFREDRYDFNLGDILLHPRLTDLQEVMVYAEKPLMESKDGKIIYNVGESALSAGASTSELLKNMPLISQDANGKILLKGKEPKILIDDKPTELNAQQLADLLESLPGNSIEKIELLTNPPAQYASESGGVINIVTKKGKVGFTGRINASYGTKGEASFSTNLSYRNKKYNISFNAGSGGGINNGTGASLRQNFYTDSINYFKTANAYHNKSIRPNARINVDYDFNKRNQLNIVTLLNANFFDNESLMEYINLNRQQEIYKWSLRSNQTNGNNVKPGPNGNLHL